MWHRILLAQHYSHSGQCMNLPTQQSERPCYKSKEFCHVYKYRDNQWWTIPFTLTKCHLCLQTATSPVWNLWTTAMLLLQIHLKSPVWILWTTTTLHIQSLKCESTWTLQLGQSYTWRLAWIMQANHGNHTSKKKWVNTWRFTGQELTYIWKR